MKGTVHPGLIQLKLYRFAIHMQVGGLCLQPQYIVCAVQVVKYVQALLGGSCQIQPHHIGVLTPYRKQVVRVGFSEHTGICHLCELKCTGREDQTSTQQFWC